MTTNQERNDKIAELLDDAIKSAEVAKAYPFEAKARAAETVERYARTYMLFASYDNAPFGEHLQPQSAPEVESPEVEAARAAGTLYPESMGQ